MEQSGIAEMRLEYLDEDEIKERELLNKPPATEKAFALIPCGFFEPHEHKGPPAEMN